MLHFYARVCNHKCYADFAQDNNLATFLIHSLFIVHCSFRLDVGRVEVQETVTNHKISLSLHSNLALKYLESTYKNDKITSLLKSVHIFVSS